MQNKPCLIYGTAWKEEHTAPLTKQAIHAGFRAIDTANQKKHYREDYVGQALRDLYEEGIRREDLFLQSKFTYVEGQDHRLPYDPQAPYHEQVTASMESTLEQLHTNYIDSYLLHGPKSYPTLTDADWEVWETMEGLSKSGQAKQIGVSNVTAHQLEELVAHAHIKPAFVQNRCFASQGWDHSVREYCLENEITYQGFSLLTANPNVLSHPQVEAIARKLQITLPQLIFRFSTQIGILPLTGTSSKNHLEEDLGIFEFELTSEQVESIQSIG